MTKEDKKHKFVKVKNLDFVQLRIGRCPKLHDNGSYQFLDRNTRLGVLKEQLIEELYRSDYKHYLGSLKIALWCDHWRNIDFSERLIFIQDEDNDSTLEELVIKFSKDCLKAYQKKHDCSVFKGTIKHKLFGRWLGEQGKCEYSMKEDHFCPYFSFNPQTQTWNSREKHKRQLLEKINQ